MTQFIKVLIILSSQGVEPVVALLQNRGVLETCIDDPNDMKTIMEEKDALAWDYVDEELFDNLEREVSISFYLEDCSESYELIDIIKSDLKTLKSEVLDGLYGENVELGTLDFTYEPISNDWKEKYKEYFHTFEICDGIVIRPPWEDESCDNLLAKYVIVIDPGMAFGTGTHETTSMCINELRKSIKAGDRILDIGTGSGILAIAAAMIGSDEVVAIELDSDAIESARNNIAENHCENKIELIHGNILDEGIIDTDEKFQVIIANLTSGILCMLIPKMSEHLANGGHLILSGILDSEESKMVDALEAEGFDVLSVENKGEWLRITATIKEVAL